MNYRKHILGLVLVLIFAMSFSSAVFADDDSKRYSKDRETIEFNFKDLKDAKWAEEYVGKMQSKDVIKGYEDGTFRPNAPVERIEAIVMAVRLMGLEDEALNKSLDTKLHFKDANEIPKWAKGHVIVALENGLFDTTEDKIQPNKPASRIWIVKLLVKALDLETEALALMTEIPEFKDTNQIPAGAIGYVNAAIKHDLITGYDDNTFRANRNVSRAEMAAFLDRTNDGLLEQSGAVTVQGKVTNISFDHGNEGDGRIVLQTANGEEVSYSISPDLLVQFHNRFIRADQLRVNDILTLAVKDNAVVEAHFVDEKSVNKLSHIIEFELELEQSKHNKLEIEYKNKKGKVKAEIESKAKHKKDKIKGKEAIEQVEHLLDQLDLDSDLSKREIVDRIVSALDLKEDSFKELEIEIKFSNGKKVEIEFENDEDDDDDDHDDDDDDDNDDDDDGDDD